MPSRRNDRSAQLDPERVHRAALHHDEAFRAAAPPGASPAPLWGSVEHVRDLFGDRVEDFVARQQALVVDRFANGAEFRDFMKVNYGPTIAVYRFIADDAEKVNALDVEMAALGDRFLDDGVMPWEYLIVTAKRR